MKADNFVFQSYLNRIGYQGDTQADIATVTDMMRCQLCTVPFENIDVQAGKVVSLVPEEIVEKIINRNRGGYCYEVNAIFAMALQSIGIPYQFVAARPMLSPDESPKTHMALVIRVNNEEWLCDLGFGCYGIREPMKLSLVDIEVKQHIDMFILSKTAEHEYLLKVLVNGEWINLYVFDIYPQKWIDFIPANYFNSTHPDVIFVQKLFIVLHEPDGRKIFLGNSLKIIKNGIVEEQTLVQEDYKFILLNEFGLTLND